ncbi:MAG: FkbM family methyltransferase, partial [Actinomycetota bacterium]
MSNPTRDSPALGFTATHGSGTGGPERRTLNACTIIARNYLPFARLLAESFAEHHPDGQLSCLIIDDTERVVDSSVEPFQIVHLDEIVNDRAELHRLAMIYDVTELATAVKPLLLRHMLAQGSHIVYLDPDIQLFAPLDDVVALAEQHSIVLTPHTTSPMSRDGRKPTEADILSSGVYNLGFLALGPGSEDFLAWWWERLRRDCIIDHQRMLFTDQRWIDFVPGYFRHYILRDPTFNVAYWNLDQRRLVWTGDRYEIDGQALRFFHFSGFNPERAYLLSKHQGHLPRVLLSERPDVSRICAAYSERLNKAGYGSDAVDSTYGWDLLPSGMKVDGRTRRVYRHAVKAAEAGAEPEPPDPFGAADVDAFLSWLNEPVNQGPRPTVSRYKLTLWHERSYLQAAFPNLTGPDAGR